MWLHAGDAGRPRRGHTDADHAARRARRTARAKSSIGKIVYLVKTGNEVRALDSTCTHLGCRTRFNPETKQIECPCHGGVYDVTGNVIVGSAAGAASR